MLTEWRVEENYVFNNNPQRCRIGARPKNKQMVELRKNRY